MTLDEGLSRLAARGLNIFAAVPLPDLPGDIRSAIPVDCAETFTLCLLGHGGRRMWDTLDRPLQPDAVDHFAVEQVIWFTREVLGDDTAIIAFPRPDWVLPLQRLGRHLNLARPSPLGLDISEDFGPWFAYRAVFLTRTPLPERRGRPFVSPCEGCTEKPCASACPAQAVKSDAGALDFKSCARYRLGDDSACADRCLARLACPVKAEHRYSLDQLRYHMTQPGYAATLLAWS